MTTTQLAFLAGGLIGLGVAVLVWRLAPAEPDLAGAIANLAPDRAIKGSSTSALMGAARTTGEAGSTRPVVQSQDLLDRLGVWVLRHLPEAGRWRVPTRELAILRIPMHRHLGAKAGYALLGLAFTPLVYAVTTLVGVTLPVTVPLLGSLLLAAALSFLPDYNVRSDAAAARVEFTRALGAYVDLVALERHAGSGPRQAMEVAARIGDSWVFTRLAEELGRSRWSGVSPWDSLTALADELGLPDLAEFADIMRLSGEEGAAVYQTLRARSASMRAAMMNNELAKANAVGERMSIPVAVLALLFLVILAVPALLRVLFTGT